MKGKGILLTLGIGLISLYAWKSLSSLKEQIVVRFHNIGLDIKKGNLVWLQLSIFNPARIQVTLNNVTGSVLLDNELIGKIISYNEYPLKPKKDNIIEVSFVPNAFGLLALPKLINAKNLNLTLDLQMMIDGINVPYSVSQLISIPSK